MSQSIENSVRGIPVAGLGVVTGLGIGMKENMEALRAGRHGMGKPTLFSTDIDVPVSEVKYTNTGLKQLLGIDERETVSRTALLGLLAAREALKDAQIAPSQAPGAFISATSVGGMDLTEQFYPTFRTDHRKGRLRQVAWHDCGASTEWIARKLGITGPVMTLSTACSSAANAIMMGARLILNGDVFYAVVGGTDALCRFTLNGFNSLKILDREHCRPFDQSRAGLNLGEGAGYLVLSAATSKFYCFLTGFANVNEAYHQTGSSPEGDGAYLAMSKAIAHSELTPDQIDYINTHGTGTPGNDASESRAIQRLFGKRPPMFSSFKPFIGHTLGASGGIEAVYSALAIRYGYIYPNLNFRTPMEETGLVPATEFIGGHPVNNVLSNSFGFGGNDTSLVFSHSAIDITIL